VVQSKGLEKYGFERCHALELGPINVVLRCDPEGHAHAVQHLRRSDGLVARAGCGRAGPGVRPATRVKGVRPLRVPIWTRTVHAYTTLSSMDALERRSLCPIEGADGDDLRRVAEHLRGQSPGVPQVLADQRDLCQDGREDRIRP
jgi:hypothetical protein